MNQIMRWEWLVFFVPLGLSALLGVSAALGIGMDGADGDHDVDADHDIDHDVDADHHVDVDHDVDHDHDTDGHGFSPLEMLGVGHAPLGVLLLCVTLFWAVLGILGNALWGIERAGWSVALAAVGTLPATAGTARLVGRLLPTHQSFSVARHELIGVEGTAIYPITATAGTVRLYDRLKTLRQLDCRVAAGAEPLPEGARVVVTDYDPQRQIFTVCRPEAIFGETAAVTTTSAGETPAEATLHQGERTS